MTRPKLRVLVADDELLARKRLTRLLAEVPSVELLGACENADEVLERTKAGDVDLLLLDIQMPGLTGLDALRVLEARTAEHGPPPLVIFCTAHSNHAVDAFESGALDYLLKPIAPDRLSKAIARAEKRLAEASSSVPSAPVAAGGSVAMTPDRLAVTTRAGVVLVDPKAITHAVLDGVLVTLSTIDADFVTDFTLHDLERKVPHLLRVHRRALLDLAHITRLEPIETGGYVARTARGHSIEVSRQAARDLRKALGLRKAPGDD
ncbi:LytTR family DNA-binding domain-containing protein [soil metagenome]